MNPEGYFSADYATARARFREAAAAAGAALHAIALPATGPRGEPLAIDIAWIGAPRPRQVLLHTSGMHGVEAYTGSAVQLALLDSPPAPGPEEALILVHVLNPYGMAWLRRTNENNVDLNRNFLMDGSKWSGAPALYRALDPLLNPKSPPARDGFPVRAAAVAVRRGFHPVKQAIAEGQYEYERGLFYGGRELQPGPRLFCDWLQQHVSYAAYVFALDLHTGLGRRGTDTVILEPEVSVSAPAALGGALGRKLIDPAKPSVAYTVRGSYGSALPHVLPRARIDFVLQEIGTYPPLKVLHALREENRCHFYGEGSIVDPAKLRLREALCPAAVDWRRKAVDRGVTLARAAARWTFGKER
ncbi:MAG TPA: DUF2817 domain-containing protein [Burkholderiales bacterium]|nr:DUF2817 domain-containing protein [Burkholderiales bacterium]